MDKPDHPRAALRPIPTPWAHHIVSAPPVLIASTNTVDSSAAAVAPSGPQSRHPLHEMRIVQFDRRMRPPRLASGVRVLRDQPSFAEMFMAYLLARNARVEENPVDQLFNSSEKRLSRLLLLMANLGKEGEPQLRAQPFLKCVHF
jgi:hypothetical protein